MKKYTQDDYREMPWKNGQGSTTELLIEPKEADLDTFEWRISSAPVTQAGAFSSFRGVDRSIQIISGAGAILHFNRQVSFTLTPTSAPLPFAGEDEVEIELLAGAVQDFNVMTRRRQWTHELQMHLISGDVTVNAKGDVMLIYLADGAELGCADGQNASLTLVQGEMVSSSSMQLQLSSKAQVCCYVVHLFKAK